MILPPDDVRDFIKDEGFDASTLQHVSFGEFAGLCVEYMADGKFWLKRWLYSGPLLLYVTYNSSATDRALEVDDVSQ